MTEQGWPRVPRSRRAFLRGVAAGGAALSLPALLAACGDDEESGGSGGEPAATTAAPPASEATTAPGSTDAATTAASVAETESTAAASAFPYPETGSADLTGDITLWAWDPGPKIFNPLIAPFNELFPNVKVTVEEIGYGDVHDKLAVAFTSGTGAPDITWCDGYFIAGFIHQDGLADMSAAMTPYLGDLPAFMVNFARPTGDDQTIAGWPNDIGPAGLWYQRKILEDNGLELPTTWDEYLEIGRALKPKGIGLMPLPKAPIGGDVTALTVLTQQNDGSFFADDGSPTIDSPKVIEALTLLRALIDDGLNANVDPSDPQMFAQWKDGKIATYQEGAWQLAYWPAALGIDAGQDTGIGFAPLPTITAGGATAANRGGSYLVVPKQSENTDAAIAFARFVLTGDVGNTALRDNGIIPAYLPALAEAGSAAEPLPEYGGQPVWQTVYDLAQAVPTSFRQPAPYIEVGKVMVQHWGEFYDGADPAAWAAKVQGEAEKVVEKYA